MFMSTLDAVTWRPILIDVRCSPCQRWPTSILSDGCLSAMLAMPVLIAIAYTKIYAAITTRITWNFHGVSPQHLSLIADIYIYRVMSSLKLSSSDSQPNTNIIISVIKTQLF